MLWSSVRMPAKRGRVIVLVCFLMLIVAYITFSESLFGPNIFFSTALVKHNDGVVAMYEAPPRLEPENPHEITVITMYIKLERFQKGGGNIYFSPDTYKKWMTTWGWLTNRVVAFFDNDEVMDNFRKIRASQPADRTVLLKVNKTSLPSFKYLNKIGEIYQQPSYPKHPPNTVNAGYSCTMNAKYDAVQIAIKRNLVPTKHLAWLDIGLFRDLLDQKLRPKNDRFTLEVPDGYNPDSIAMAEVGPRHALKNKSPWDFIKENNVWVGGAFNLGTRESLLQFSTNYASAVDYLIAQNMSSTDQQVIASMYSPALLNRQTVDLMTLKCKSGQFGLQGSDLEYFSMGYICKQAAEIRQGKSNQSDLDTNCKFSTTLEK